MISRNWVKISTFSWRSASSSQSAAQALKLAAVFRRVVARAGQLVRVVADLLELHELGEDEPRRWMPSASSSFLARSRTACS